MNYTKYLSSFIVALTLCLSLTGCYDDSVLKEQYKDLESRVTELERIANQLNTNVTALQTIVNALQEKDYVTSVAPINEGSKVIGYTITFSQSGTVTIYHGKNGEDGKNGIDGYAPIIGVAQDADKQWYWTIDGTWMLDGKGNKVRASAQDGKDGKDGAPGSPGITPQLKIVDGFWYVSYDGGATWEEETLGQATGDKGYTMFAEVTYDEYYLYITMSDGEVLSIPRTPSDENNDNQVGPIQITLAEISETSIIFKGKVTSTSYLTYIEEIAIFYKEASEPFSIISAEKAATSEINSDNTISINITVPYNTSYNYCVYVKSQGVDYYGDIKKFSVNPIVPKASIDKTSITATTVTINGYLDDVLEKDLSMIRVGVVYSMSRDDIQSNSALESFGGFSETGAFTVSLDNLLFNTKYYYCPCFVNQNGIYTYGEIDEFTTDNITISSASLDLSTLNGDSASASFRIYGLSDKDIHSIEVGIVYSYDSSILMSNNSQKTLASEITSDGTCLLTLNDLHYQYKKYYYCSYIKQKDKYYYDDSVGEFVPGFKQLDLSLATDLSSSATANCYIVSKPGIYKFKTVKGNSSVSIGEVTSCTILWESFGTSVKPDCWSLISATCFNDNYIAFQIPDSFKEGNAVIAAKDKEDNILWSWHIWLTDRPKEQIYYNNAGTMMDRNLGATSATPGDVCALGLMYQWGRKDPFLGSSSISENTIAASTISWPKSVTSSISMGTIDYSIANPTTFIDGPSWSGTNYDWYYTGNESTDDTRWLSTKTIYDPCPAGWRVPDGGSEGVWSKALGTSEEVYCHNTYDDVNMGLNLYQVLGEDLVIWYPMSGLIRGGYKYDTGSYSYYWSVTPSDNMAYHLVLTHYGTGNIRPSNLSQREEANPIRCIKESL